MARRRRRASAVPVYTTEGGWLHLSPDTLVRETLAAQDAGFKGAKIKVGKPHLAEDLARLRAVRATASAKASMIVDPPTMLHRCPRLLKRAPRYAALGIAWFEEPLPADDLTGHARLAAASEVPIAVGESLYSPGQFGDYVRARRRLHPAGRRGACRRHHALAQGGAPGRGLQSHVAPHFLMELHVSLTAATPAARWVEYIPQLDAVATSRLVIEDGHALAPQSAGLGIAWRWDEIEPPGRGRHILH